VTIALLAVSPGLTSDLIEVGNQLDPTSQSASFAADFGGSLYARIDPQSGVGSEIHIPLKLKE
jgi:hypothetical protein